MEYSGKISYFFIMESMIEQTFGNLKICYFLQVFSSLNLLSSRAGRDDTTSLWKPSSDNDFAVGIEKVDILQVVYIQPRLLQSSISSLNPFHANVPFPYPQEALENRRFSGGIEMEHQREMGLKKVLSPKFCMSLCSSSESVRQDSIRFLCISFLLILD